MCARNQLERDQRLGAESSRTSKKHVMKIGFPMVLSSEPFNNRPWNDMKPILPNIRAEANHIIPSQNAQVGKFCNLWNIKSDRQKVATAISYLVIPPHPLLHSWETRRERGDFEKAKNMQSDVLRIRGEGDHEDSRFTLQRSHTI